ncbi:hypothetical protein E2C01_089399 [Portunus trituberculatus]|uniref:Uncharacterized protein n=1 Tax=Portunus trituberculatus TaxID=210409 RepID=A0A5B7JMA1_PORTR|nr:hypothetical protein [Portunus trituberculatus]
MGVSVRPRTRQALLKARAVSVSSALSKSGDTFMWLQFT